MELSGSFSHHRFTVLNSPLLIGDYPTPNGSCMTSANTRCIRRLLCNSREIVWQQSRCHDTLTICLMTHTGKTSVCIDLMRCVYPKMAKTQLKHNSSAAFQSSISQHVIHCYTTHFHTQPHVLCSRDVQNFKIWPLLPAHAVAKLLDCLPRNYILQVPLRIWSDTHMQLLQRGPFPCGESMHKLFIQINEGNHQHLQQWRVS